MIIMADVRVKVKNLSKNFDNNVVLDRVSMELEKGKIYGLIGRNGSGKTVLMKCICGFLLPSSGEILIDGQKMSENAHLLNDFGIIIEAPGFLPNYSAVKNLQLLSSIRGRCDLNNASLKHTADINAPAVKPVSDLYFTWL